MDSGYDLRVVVDDVVTHPFRLPRPDPSTSFPAVRFAVSPRPVEGYLVGVRDGSDWGWWGPVTDGVAERLRRLVSRATGRLRGTPEECAHRLRRGTRHAHAGVYSVSIGAFELACWDLLGQRHRAPVWRLFTTQPAIHRVPAYATCFGIRLDNPLAAEVVRRVRDVWPIQKWRPVRGLSRAGSQAKTAAEAAGPGGLALDFGGVWPTAAALRYTTAARLDLAWIEEPAPPGGLAELRPHRRPAPIAAGEHCYNVDETAVLLDADIDVWQPDAVFCGGFSALRAIAARATAASRPLYPHGGGLLPAIHAAVIGSATERVEHHLLLEPRRQAHLRRPMLPGPEGEFALPELPGWAGPLRSDLELG